MEYRFQADEWRGLSLAERVRRCRTFAAEAQDLANHAPAYSKHLYEKIAQQWATLAAEIERESEQE